MPDCRRIPDTTTWTKPPYFGRTIALWGLYSAFILGRSSWNGPESVGNTPLCYRRARCGAIVLTKHTVALGTAAKRLSPSGVIGSQVMSLLAVLPLLDQRFASVR